MRRMRIRERVTLVATAVLLAVLAVACSYPAPRFERRAPHSGTLTPAQVAAVLATVPGATFRALPARRGAAGHWLADEVSATAPRGRITAQFSVVLTGDPPEIVVSLTTLRPEHDPTERQRVEELCLRIGTACPSVGAWEDGRTIGPPTRTERILTLGIFLSVPVGAVLATVWLVRRASRRSER